MFNNWYNTLRFNFFLKLNVGLLHCVAYFLILIIWHNTTLSGEERFGLFSPTVAVGMNWFVGFILLSDEEAPPFFFLFRLYIRSSFCCHSIVTRSSFDCHSIVNVHDSMFSKNFKLCVAFIEFYCYWYFVKQ